MAGLEPKIEIQHIDDGDAEEDAPNLMIMDADKFASLDDEDVLGLRDKLKGVMDNVGEESEAGMEEYASTSQKNMYKYLLNEDHRSFDMGKSEPHRVGSLVRAREGSDLYRYLSDYHKSSSISLKVEDVNVFNEGTHDYLVSLMSDSHAWLASQPLPVAHEDIEAIGSILTGSPGSMSREGTGEALQEDV